MTSSEQPFTHANQGEKHMNPVLGCLAYPVGIAVSNIIGKIIDYKYTQTQAHRFRQEELKQQYEQNITKSFIDSRIRIIDSEFKIHEQKIIEDLRSSYSISTKKALVDLARKDANSPFFDGIDETYKVLNGLHKKTGLPIILVSPFWDDTRPKDKNDPGGYVDFRTAFNSSYSWHNLASKQDGYFKRPLYQTDRDINYIYSVLFDIPTILVHGTIQGVHAAHQHVQRIHPRITFWNLFPEQQGSYTSLSLKFFPFQLPIGNGNRNSPDPDIYRQIGEYSLNLQETVSKYLAKGIGLLSSFYHLYCFETRPNLQQFELENEQELEILSLQVNEIYDFLAQNNPNKVNYYELEKSVISLERDFDEIKRNKELALKRNSKLNLEANEIYCWFTERLEKIARTIIEFEQQECIADYKSLVDTLQESIKKLLNIDNQFRFLIVGDFNSGKSSILNAFFEKSLLPMGATATTALPTVVKYGEQEEVIVYKKDGEEERLSFEQFKKKYTLNSKEVKNQIKKVFKSVGSWLNALDYAEFYCPIEVLSRGVEFIDTAGLNHTEEKNQKIFSYIQQSHAILFVLAADKAFTQQQKNYLESLLGIGKEIEDSESTSSKNSNTRQVRPIFYLINKWENVGKDETEEIHEAFVDTFCECLGINEDEAVKMWGNTVFDVYAKTALENLEQGKSIDGTGLKELQKRLNDFLMSNEVLKTKLSQAVQIAEFVKSQIASKSNYRLILHEPTDVSNEAKIKHLQALQDNISVQVEIIEAKYNEIVSRCD